MAYEQKPNSGSLFKNDRKQTDKHPDYKGDGKVTCEKCGHESPIWLSAWIKKGATTFMSLAFQKKEPKQAAPAQAESNKPSDNCPPEDDGGVPF